MTNMVGNDSKTFRDELKFFLNAGFAGIIV